MRHNWHVGQKKEIKMDYQDCPACGQPEHISKFRKCGRCEQYICQWCRNNTHECRDVYSDENERGDLE